MATIPIEVIVQDAEAPIVPSEDGTNNTETNITVPDTGTISNNGDTSSSASSIILPAILLVLAIGSIMAILIHKYHKQKNNKTTRKEKLATVVSGTIAILAATVLVGNLVIPATSAATNVEPGTADLETVDKITIIAIRESDNDSDTITATVKNTSYATANLDFGYKVTASMAEGVANANLYLDGNTDSPYYIAPVEDGALEDNTWGYRLSEEDEDYLTIPLANAPATIIKGNDNTIEDKPVDIYYTIKVDKSLPVGTYTGELEYALTDNNFPTTLTTMQGMTTEICENTYTSGNQVTDPVPTATLEDTRDHKTYTIAKLADGKCWMTQNLDLDLKKDGSIVYDSANTNLTVAGSGAYENGYTTENGIITWTPANATIDFDGDTVEGWSDSNTTPYSANPDDVYYYSSGSDADDIRYNSLAECVAADHTAEDCKHYHAGDYYNWSAAVASNDSSSLTTQYDNAANSICPAGWRLPKGPSAENVYYREMLNTIKSYNGVLGETIAEGCGGSCNRYEYLGGGFNAIRVNPFWLVRPGYIAVYGGATLANAGEDGTYLSSTVYGDYMGYSFALYSNGIPLKATFVRGYGGKIRCVAE